MSGSRQSNDDKDQKEARTLVIALAVLTLLVMIAVVLALPVLADFHQLHLAPGVGLKSAAAISFIVTLIVLVVFAVAAGDGLLGELQFMLAGFFSFFLVVWLLIAWIF